MLPLAFSDFCPYNYGMKTTDTPRMGRPPKSGEETLSERLELRVTSGEKAAYDQAAEATGMERSDWIRLILKRAAKKASREQNRSSEEP